MKIARSHLAFLLIFSTTLGLLWLEARFVKTLGDYFQYILIDFYLTFVAIYLVSVTLCSLWIRFRTGRWDPDNAYFYAFGPIFGLIACFFIFAF